MSAEVMAGVAAHVVGRVSGHVLGPVSVPSSPSMATTSFAFTSAASVVDVVVDSLEQPAAVTETTMPVRAVKLASANNFLTMIPRLLLHLAVLRLRQGC